MTDPPGPGLSVFPEDDAVHLATDRDVDNTPELVLGHLGDAGVQRAVDLGHVLLVTAGPQLTGHACHGVLREGGGKLRR